jgi:hypothetical protein
MILNNGDNWQPEETDVIAWQRAFPKVDVHQELMAMESWLDANPTRRKKPTGIKRFVNSWLSRSQEQGGSSPIAKQYNKPDSIRAKTLEMQMADVTWVDSGQVQMMKEFYLNKFGYYYDGEIRDSI